MKKRKETVTYIIWAVLYVLCVCMSLLERATGWIRVLQWVMFVAFYIPGAVLVARALKEKNMRTLKILRIVSAASLALTAILLVANFLSVGASAQTGRILNSFLLLVSAPMGISPSWAMSIFLWACLLMATFPGIVDPKKK